MCSVRKSHEQSFVNQIVIITFASNAEFGFNWKVSDSCEN